MIRPLARRNERRLFVGNSHWFAVLSVAVAIGIIVWLTYGGAGRDRWLAVALGL
jgi:hypothetical protein